MKAETHKQRLEEVSRLIDSGAIHEFKEIFLYLPKSVLAEQLGKNNARVESLIFNPEELTYMEIRSIGELLQVRPSQVMELIENQVIKDP